MPTTSAQKINIKGRKSELISFTWEDMELFSAASHDLSPLHCSKDYARNTSFGSPILFGMLAEIACLGKQQKRNNYRLSKVKVEFSQAMYPEVEYQLNITEDLPHRATVKIYDDHRLMLKLVTQFQPGPTSAPEKMLNYSTFADHIPNILIRRESAHLQESDLVAGYTVAGDYVPDLEKMRLLIERFNLSEKGMDARQIATILWQSYLAGMELPGRQSLCGKMSLNFEQVIAPTQPQFSYQAKVLFYDSSLHLIKIGAELVSQQTSWATGQLQIFFRTDFSTDS